MKRTIIVSIVLIAGMLLAMPSAGEDYRPGPDDVLMIHVADHPELSAGEAVVSRSGTITHAVWGEIRVEGMSLSNFEVALTKRLADEFIKDARVNVSVRQANTLLVYLLAQNGITSAYRLSINGRLSELLVRAALTPESCKRTMAVILRREPPQKSDATTPDENASPPEMPVKTMIDLYELMIMGRKEVDVPLRRNDWVRLVNRDPRRNQSYVFVIGNEKIPTQAHEFSVGATLADLIPPGSPQDVPLLEPPRGRRRVSPGEFVVLGDWPAGDEEIAVFGAVEKAGVQMLSANMTLGEAVANAGAAHDAGSLARIVLARRRSLVARDATKIRKMVFYKTNTSPNDGYGIKQPLIAGDVVFVISDKDE
ncbi:MAG: polysaccharide biosynthesis/export family protein [Planctomycetes bacterium]|nr:polysaccharide biosynthesis/export family protein [Planctomycetota bacterium]